MDGDKTELVAETEKLLTAQSAVGAQKSDKMLWEPTHTLKEAYLRQSLEDLHKIIDEGDRVALSRIRKRVTNPTL